MCWPIHSHIFSTTEGNFIWLIEIKVEWLSNEHNQILETFWDDDTDVSLLTPRQTGWWVVLELIQKTIYLVEQTFNIQSTFQSYQSNGLKSLHFVWRRNLSFISHSTKCCIIILQHFLLFFRFHQLNGANGTNVHLFVCLFIHFKKYLYLGCNLTCSSFKRL